jgi:hypothetical protein
LSESGFTGFNEVLCLYLSCSSFNSFLSESGFTGFKDLQDLIKYFVCIHSVYSLIGGYPESDIFLVCIYPVNPLILVILIQTLFI